MNDPDVTRFLENGIQRYSAESLRAYVNQISKNSAYSFQAIFDMASQRHIGNLKLGPINWIHRFADLGIIIGIKELWGKGYASEAIALMVKYAFQNLNLHKITAGCNALNSGSLRAFQKNGFEIEGVRKEQFLGQGRFIDGILLGLINRDYKHE